MERYCYQSPLGWMTLICSEGALVQIHFAETKPQNVSDASNSPLIRDAVRWLTAYFRGRVPSFTPPLAPQGTPFQQAVWQALQAIPYGETCSYGDLVRILSRQLGKPRLSAQAIGRAVGSNPIALIIPCHRVIGANGALTGYRWGLKRKANLLAFEKLTRSNALGE